MSRRALLVLLGVLVALGLAAALTSFRGERSEGPGLLYPDLKGQLESLTRVTVKSGGDTTVATLVRTDAGTWQLEEARYGADVAKLRRNLVALADAVIVEEKTSSPELYERIGVEDIADAEARGVQLDIVAGANPVASVIIGDTGVSGGKMAYVRRAGEAQSWLVAADLEVGKTVADWLDREIVDIPAARIQAVTVTHPDGALLRLRKDSQEQEDFAIANLPANRKPNFEGVANGIGAVLSGLNLEAVQGRDALGTDPGKPVVARFETFDGLVVEISAWRLGEGTRITVSASAAPAQPDTKAPEAGTDPGKEAAAINARVGGFVYTIPSFKTEQLTRRVEDLTQSG